MKPTKIYSLPGDFSEEEKAVIFAKCARSPEPFTEIAETVTKEGAAQFHEKFVLNYGHASVGEMAIPDFAFEGVSILASKILESMPRGAYQEKSTRAQNFLFKDEHGNYTAYYIPPELEGEQRRFYIESMEALFATYEKLHDPMMEWAQKKTGSDKFVAKRRAFDSLRYLLPVGTQTNLGMRINGRDIAVLITKLLSSPLAEFRALGTQLKEVAVTQLPTLVRHADSNSYLNTIRELSEKAWTDSDRTRLLPVDLAGRNYCLILHDPPPPNMTEDQHSVMTIAKALMSHYGSRSPIEMQPSEEFCYALVEDILSKRGKHDPFPDELDLIQFSADMVMDYGAFRDLQRHRNCTQLVQLPQLSLGFDIPDDVREAGGEIESEFVKTLELAGRGVILFKDQIGDDPKFYGAERYTNPLAYRHRMIMQMSMKQAAYMIELRSAPQGHISYRRTVKELHTGLIDVYPTAAGFIRCHEID